MNITAMTSSLKSLITAVWFAIGLVGALVSVPAMGQSQLPGSRPAGQAVNPIDSQPTPSQALPAGQSGNNDRLVEQSDDQSRVFFDGMQSTVKPYGSWLFSGNFGGESFSGFNPNYQIAQGDVIDIRLWGAFNYEAQSPVDAQGHIFIPSVGPILVLNTRNSELNEIVSAAVRKVYRQNVNIYAALAGQQSVKIFVSGNVVRPGLYGASATDSVLHFIDRAGGVHPGAGSYLDISVKRGGANLLYVNLYDFIQSGFLPFFQFQDGDVIFVGQRKNTVDVSGLVHRPSSVEFSEQLSIQQLMKLVGMDSRATHISVTRPSSLMRQAFYFSLKDITQNFLIMSGDTVEFVADQKVSQIIVRVEGEHLGDGQHVLPYNSTLSDLLGVLTYDVNASKEGLQIYRKSLARRQKDLLDDMLDKLELSIYSARSATLQEAGLRTQEAQLVERFIERARNIEPRGQLILNSFHHALELPLEDGDVIRVPRATPTVAVHGEVYFPNHFIFDQALNVRDYIQHAGGYTQLGDANRVIVMAKSGEISIINTRSLFSNYRLSPGDEILVVPAVERKSFQFGKDVVEVIYQVALATGVVLRL